MFLSLAFLGILRKTLIKLLELLQKTLIAILDCMLCSISHALWNSWPFLTKLHCVLHKLAIFLTCPLTLVNIGVKIIAPAFSTLLRLSKVLFVRYLEQIFCDLIPTSLTFVILNYFNQHIILILSPWLHSSTCFGKSKPFKPTVFSILSYEYASQSTPFFSGEIRNFYVDSIFKMKQHPHK